MAKKAPEPPKEEAPKRRGMFARFADLDHGGGGDLVNFTPVIGANRIRVISKEPVLVFKHWDLPQSSDVKGAVPCRRFVKADQMDAYTAVVDKAAEIADKEESAAVVEAWLEANCGTCEYCQWGIEHPGFYTKKDHWVFIVVHEGVVKMADIYQPSILRELTNFENDEDWQEMLGDEGLINLEINLKKTSTGPKAQNVEYAVTGIPGSKKLEPEQLAEYLKAAPDVLAIKTPPDQSPEGKAKWAELLGKAGKPKDGEKPKGFGNG